VKAALIGTKNLCQRHTIEHPRPAADRSYFLTNRSKAAIGPGGPDPKPRRQYRRQLSPRRDRRRGRSAILPVRLVRMRPRVTSCFPRRRVNCAFSIRKASGVGRESAEGRCFGLTGSRIQVFLSVGSCDAACILPPTFPRATLTRTLSAISTVSVESSNPVMRP
jgi:hypothetical protein